MRTCCYGSAEYHLRAPSGRPDMARIQAAALVGRTRFMMAVGFAEFGGPEMLRMIEQPDPSPAADEVVVAVHASTVNPTDVLTLSGARASLMTDLTPPYIAGMDFSGRVLSVGSAVAAVRPGQPVIGVVSPRRLEGGSQAE